MFDVESVGAFAKVVAVVVAGAATVRYRDYIGLVMAGFAKSLLESRLPAQTTKDLERIHGAIQARIDADRRARLEKAGELADRRRIAKATAAAKIRAMDAATAKRTAEAEAVERITAALEHLEQTYSSLVQAGASLSLDLELLQRLAEARKNSGKMVSVSDIVASGVIQPLPAGIEVRLSSDDTESP